MADDVHYSLYIDGTIYDPFSDNTVGIISTTDLYVFGATVPPMPGPGENTDQQVTADMDYFAASYYGFDLGDVFRDDFNSSGFTNWTVDPPTSPGNFQESSGMARLNYLASSYPSTNTGGNIHDLTFPAAYKHTYFTIRVKVFDALNPPDPSPTPTSSHVCPVAALGMDAFTCQLSLDPTSVIFDNLAVGGGSHTVSGLTLDDGNWHIIGIHRHALSFPAAPIRGAGTLGYYKDGEWHLIEDLLI
jgi:hypothetical protein